MFGKLGVFLLYNKKSCMNNRKSSSIDGFIPRRPNAELGSLNTINSSTPRPPKRKEMIAQHDVQNVPLGVPRAGKEMYANPTTRSDIEDVLRDLDDPNQQIPTKKLSRREKKRLKKERRSRNQTITRRIALTLMWIIIAAAVAGGGFLAYKTILASGKMLQGNFFDIVTKNQPLQEDANGRSNFLIFGTAEDSEGGQHGGANLTDSIMVVSVSQNKKDAYMLSLPRDLWVKYELPDNEPCSVGYQGKLNAQYFCASNDGEDEDAGAKALGQKVSEITGLDVHYYVHLNFTAVVEAVDAVGGVDVTIQTDDPRGILDRNFDWRCKYTCYYVNYKQGEKVHLDGEHALALARARNAAGGYGVGDNFGREQNQQMIIKALLQKAVSAGTLTNLGAVTGLIDALGNNLRTNVQTKEVRTLMDLGMNIPVNSLVSLSLNGDEALVTTGPYNGQSIVRPIRGLLDYSEIVAYVKKEISSEPFVKENAQLMVLNGTGVAGVAQTFSNMLEDKGFTVGAVDNAPEGSYGKVTIYQIDNSKSATAAKLKDLYGVTIKTTTPPVSVMGETDFVIIIGDASLVEV